MVRPFALLVLVAAAVTMVCLATEQGARPGPRKPRRSVVTETDSLPESSGLARLPSTPRATAPAAAPAPVAVSCGGVPVERKHSPLGLAADATNVLELGLRWFALRAGPDGAWGSVRDTALVLLAFLGAGYTDRGTAKENQYADAVQAGFAWLTRQQQPGGRFAADAETQALATLALTELWWWTRDPRYRAPARNALGALARMRRPQAGWERDVRVTAWATLALRVGRWAGLEVDPDAFLGARAEVELQAVITDPAERAAGLLTRILLGENPRESAAVAPTVDWLARDLPHSDAAADPDRWLLGLLAAYQVGGRTWPPWYRAAMDLIRHEQRNRPAGPHPEGWPPADDRCAPLATHATLLLCLEVENRYPRVFDPRR